MGISGLACKGFCTLGGSATLVTHSLSPKSILHARGQSTQPLHAQRDEGQMTSTGTACI